MRKSFKILSVIFAAVLILSCVPFSASAAYGKWVGSWSTSPVETCVEIKGNKFSDILIDSTVRIFLQPTISGKSVRFKFSNLYGDKPLIIKSACVARADTSKGDKSAVLPETAVGLRFSGGIECVVPPGKSEYSDPVSFSVKALESIAVSYYVEDGILMKTGGLVGAESFMCLGKHINDASLGIAAPLSLEVSGLRMNTVPFLTNMDVYAADDAYSIAIIGDSTVCNDIPQLLAERLVESGVENIGVLQQAIKGNRLLYEGVGFLGNLYGESVMDRFYRDAINQTGVKKIFVKIGLNDILHPRTASMEGKAPYASVEEIIAGYEKLCELAHQGGKEIYFFTKTPWKGYTREILFSSSPDLIWS